MHRKCYYWTTLGRNSMKYQGEVTDNLWTRSLMVLSPIQRSAILKSENYRRDIKVIEAFDFVYSLKRQPRVFNDELK